MREKERKKERETKLKGESSPHPSSPFYETSHEVRFPKKIAGERTWACVGRAFSRRRACRGAHTPISNLIFL